MTREIKEAPEKVGAMIEPREKGVWHSDVIQRQQKWPGKSAQRFLEDLPTEIIRRGDKHIMNKTAYVANPFACEFDEVPGFT